MPFKAFFSVLAEVRRRIPHHRVACPVPSLQDRPAVALSLAGKLTYGQTQAALHRIQVYVRQHQAARVFEIARLLHISYDLAQKVVAAGVKFCFLKQTSSYVQLYYNYKAPD